MEFIEIPLSTQVKNIFEEALTEGETTIIFEPWSSCYKVTFETGIGFNTFRPDGKSLKNALNANRKKYSFNQKSTSAVTFASKENPYIVIRNLKRKDWPMTQTNTMQKPRYTMPEIIDWLNELDNPKQTIEDQSYTLYPFFERNIRLSNDVMEILIEPANRRHNDYLARAIISTRGYLDLPHSEEIAMRIPLKLPLDLAPENLIPFVEKTIANCSNKPIYFDN